MTTNLFDTLTRAQRPLPASPEPIGMYFCGPTVYSRAHIGNARPFVVGILLARWLRSKGHSVNFVHNITDVNDKIYDAAGAETSTEVAERATEWYEADIAAFGLGMPDSMPRVSDTIPEIIDFVSMLIDADYAYVADQDVYYRATKFENYGAISGQRDTLEVTEPNPKKENPLDFALWKGTKPDEDTSWDSPWGKGRPGWHIECSAMARKELGDEFAIHGGGIDLCFPHHENELAQSQALGLGFADIWMHNGLLEFTGEKMSKSDGNIETIDDALSRWGSTTLIALFLAVHWRRPMDYSEETLLQASRRVRTLHNALAQEPRSDDPSRWAELEACLDDNFDTAQALVVLHAWAADGEVALLHRGLELFGLLPEVEEAPPEIHELAKARAEAKADRDFDRADALRAEIEAAGWALQDGADGAFELERLGPRPSA